MVEEVDNAGANQAASPTHDASACKETHGYPETEFVNPAATLEQNAARATSENNRSEGKQIANGSARHAGLFSPSDTLSASPDTVAAKIDDKPAPISNGKEQTTSTPPPGIASAESTLSTEFLQASVPLSTSTASKTLKTTPLKTTPLKTTPLKTTPLKKSKPGERLYAKAAEIEARKAQMREESTKAWSFSRSPHQDKRRASTGRTRPSTDGSLGESRPRLSASIRSSSAQKTRPHTSEGRIESSVRMGDNSGRKTISSKQAVRLYELGMAAKAERERKAKELAATASPAFSPTIVTKSKARTEARAGSSSGKGSFAERLYNPRHLTERDERLQRSKEKAELEGCTFSPLTNNTTSSGRGEGSGSGPVWQRLYQRGQHSGYVERNQEEIDMQGCTFSPDISKSQRKLSASSGSPMDAPVYIRLAERGQVLATKKEVERIRSSLHETTKDAKKSKEGRKSIDGRRIEKLYNDGLKKSLKTRNLLTDKDEKEALKRRLEDEELANCTFAPKTNWKKENSFKSLTGNHGEQSKVLELRANGTHCSPGKSLSANMGAEQTPCSDIVTTSTTAESTSAGGEERGNDIRDEINLNSIEATEDHTPNEILSLANAIENISRAMDAELLAEKVEGTNSGPWVSNEPPLPCRERPAVTGYTESDLKDDSVECGSI